jgi:hypothetical protein
LGLKIVRVMSGHSDTSTPSKMSRTWYPPTAEKTGGAYQSSNMVVSAAAIVALSERWIKKAFQQSIIKKF